MSEKKSEGSMLHYNGKPLVRRGNMIYYGNPKDKYMILFIISKTEDLMGLDISSRVVVQLQSGSGGKNNIVKEAEREGMYAAMDLAEYWLDEALGNI